MKIGRRRADTLFAPSGGKWAVLLLLIYIVCSCKGQPVEVRFAGAGEVVCGDEQPDAYLPLLTSKRVAILANHTSMIKGKHLLDLLLDKGINVRRIFSPEHGFRGNAGAGEHVANGKDAKTGIEIISLYGKHRKPAPEDLQDIDIVVYDIQDAGVRFYTYISTMGWMMQACARAGIPLLILDRPNPHGHYIDGPVLDTAFRSFVGMYPIPVVYGLTAGELARMTAGEKWIKDAEACELHIIPLKNYSHTLICSVEIPPSPNLPTMKSIELYPSLCFFEGTPISVGRGTKMPFQIYGAPALRNGNITFRPQSIPGVAPHPKYEGQLCRGYSLTDSADIQILKGEINIRWLMQAYREMKKNNDFFTPFFDLLAGTDMLRKQIEAGASEREIRAQWRAEIEIFKQRRKKYLLYDDFE